ncbi:unnamed protein product [Pseudo-nitzschia multistriata]|uniref:Uncharacterized protein n=1 Tax=Pseudo-nitzschia multistriata TaxID=183589 RepID=A0A448YVS6_9STRA|nr:unnamed protein product [Pseudo-nitzschia multistriata]
MCAAKIVTKRDEKPGDSDIPASQCPSLEEFIRLMQAKVSHESNNAVPAAAESSCSESGDSSCAGKTESSWSSASSFDDSEDGGSEAVEPRHIALMKTATVEETSANSNIKYNKNQKGSRLRNKNDYGDKKISGRYTNYPSETKKNFSDTSAMKKGSSPAISNAKATLDLSSALRGCKSSASLDLSDACKRYREAGPGVSGLGARAFRRQDDWVGGSANELNVPEERWKVKATDRSRSNRYF